MRWTALLFAVLFPAPLFAGESYTAPKSQRATDIRALTTLAKTDRTATAQLLERVQAEKDPRLHKFAVSALLREDVLLDSAQKRQLLKLVREAGRGPLPKRFPRPGKGSIEVRHFSGAEFFEDELKNLSARGFTVKQNGDIAEATRGRLHVIVRKGPQGLLADMSDPKVSVILYSGHANFGGVVERELSKMTTQQRGTKLVALLQCDGTKTLPIVKAQLPLAHVITTHEASYDEDDAKVIRAIYDGVEKGWDYKRIRNAAGKNPNYIYPDQVATLQHQDFDRDGRLDIHGGPAAFAQLGAAEHAAAQKLLSGVHYVTNMNPYYAEETHKPFFDKRFAAKPIIAAGIVDGDGKTVTQIRPTEVDGVAGFSVALDSSFARANPAFVGTAAVYELELHLMKEKLGAVGPLEKARAFTFAIDYAFRMFPYADTSALAMQQLSEHAQLPATDYQALAKAAMSPKPVANLAVKRVNALHEKAALK